MHGPLTLQRRRIMLASIASHDTRSARDAFNNLSHTERESPMSRYLMYKVGLEDHDAELGTFTASCRVAR